VTRWLGAHRIDLVECGSTNDEAARLARAGASHGTIVIAESQRAGRGRDGRAWASPRGVGLYLSAVLRPPLPLVDVPPMTLAIGVACCDAARRYAPEVVLKWPNDLLVGSRKLGGVLVEAQSQGSRLEAVIVGIGINLHGELPQDVGGITLADAGGTSIVAPLAAEHGAARSIDREAFINDLLAEIERWVDRYVACGLPAIIPAWTARMAIGLAARATVDGAPLTGELAGLDRDGSLLLRDGAGAIHRVRSGDVELVHRTC